MLSERAKDHDTLLCPERSSGHSNFSYIARTRRKAEPVSNFPLKRIYTANTCARFDSRRATQRYAHCPLPTSINQSTNQSTNHSIPSFQIPSPLIPPNNQILPPHRILHHQPFLVRQMQETNESVRGADIRHLLFGVRGLQVIHYGGEF